ncbi:MAG: peptidylprolyl isomerase [Verrucomicrobiota bacterium]
MKSNSRLVAALRASALLGLVACKPSAPTAEAAKSPSAAAPASAPADAPAPAPSVPTPAPDAATAAAKAEKAPDANAIPANVLEDLIKKAKPPEPPAAPLPAVVAVVEGQEIKKEELELALNNVLASQGIPADQLPAAQRTEGYKMLLNELITEKLVEKRSAQVEVKDEDINGRLEQLKSRFPNPEAFDQQLTKAGQTIDKLREDIRTSIRQQNWIEDQLKDSPKATDADAQDFFTKNPQQFERPEQVRASHILISVAKDATPEVVAEKQKAAEAIAARVKGGEAFDKLAAEVSEDPSAKQNSGDLNFFSKEQMVPEFSTAAFGMKKGDISDPVRSQFGFHIINVTDRKDPEKMTLESVKPQLMAFLNRRMHDEQMQTLLKDLREKAQVEVKLP